MLTTRIRCITSDIRKMRFFLPCLILVLLSACGWKETRSSSQAIDDLKDGKAIVYVTGFRYVSIIGINQKDFIFFAEETSGFPRIHTDQLSGDLYDSRKKARAYNQSLLKAIKTEQASAIPKMLD